MVKKFLMYGAGNIGRGFIGQVFSEAGWQVSFLDINEKVIDALNRDKQYPINIVSDKENREVMVKNVRGVLANDNSVVANEISGCDMMATALGVNVLKYIIAPLSMGIKLRIDAKKPLNIIICENLIGADKYLKELLLKELPEKYAPLFDKYIGLVEASIGRMVPVMDEAMQAGNILRVYVEEYNTLPVDKDAFIGEIPKIKNLLPYSPFSMYIQRKLFMHNMSHALTAYLGNLYGDKYIYQAICRPEIRAIVYGALIESARAVAKENKADIDSLIDHAGDLIYRFQNAALADTVERVGKDTIRKLSYSDRLTGALRLCGEHGVRPAFICVGIAAALLFAPPSDIQAAEVSSYCKQNGVFETLVKYTGLNRKFASNPQVKYIAELYDMLSGGADLNAVIKFSDKAAHSA